MRIFDTSTLNPKSNLGPDLTSWVYNGLDCCLTHEIMSALKEELEATPECKETYETAMKKCPPVLSMMRNGLLVDPIRKNSFKAELNRDLQFIQDRFDLLCTEVLGYTVNPNSPLQMKTLFYGSFGMTERKKRNAKGLFVPTVDEEALEEFAKHPFVRFFVRPILNIRKLRKLLSFLETEIDSDGYMRTSLNIAGTDTGRMASQFSALGTGTNLQNVTNVMRQIFRAEPGRIFVNVDLEQADARNVGARLWQTFYDEYGAEAAGSYLDACESGDLHTTVCAMAWKELDWPALTDLKAARAIADSVYKNDTSYRDYSKKLGHGTNYFGLPRTMAIHTKTDTNIIRDFQRNYFKAFPLLGQYGEDPKQKLQGHHWHSWIAEQLRETQTLYNLFGRKRRFFSSPSSATTLRAAIAYDPQSTTGEFLDRGWLNLFTKMRVAKLHIPVHDSILYSLPYSSHLPDLIEESLHHLRISIELKGGREFTVPLEAKVGWNWGDAKYNKKTGLWSNPAGLRVWSGKVEHPQPEEKSLGQRILGR